MFSRTTESPKSLSSLAHVFVPAPCNLQIKHWCNLGPKIESYEDSTWNPKGFYVEPKSPYGGAPKNPFGTLFFQTLAGGLMAQSRLHCSKHFGVGAVHYLLVCSDPDLHLLLVVTVEPQHRPPLEKQRAVSHRPLAPRSPQYPHNVSVNPRGEILLITE